MKMNLQEIIAKKLLDTQENVRDFESYSKRVDEEDVVDAFKNMAEECGLQAAKLQELEKKYKRDKDELANSITDDFTENSNKNPDDFE